MTFQGLTLENCGKEIGFSNALNNLEKSLNFIYSYESNESEF